MTLLVVASTFALVAVAELPDKTMIAALLLGSRHRPLPVWAGASAAFAVHVTLAVAAGRLLELLPHRALQFIVVGIFLAGAVYLLAVPEGAELAKGEREVAAGDHGTADATANERRRAEVWWRVALTAFGVIFLGEFGDLTQLLTVNLVARTHQPWSVFVGALAALVTVSLFAAFAGRALLRIIPASRLRIAGGLVLVGLGIYGIVGLIR